MRHCAYHHHNMHICRTGITCDYICLFLRVDSNNYVLSRGTETISSNEIVVVCNTIYNDIKLY